MTFSKSTFDTSIYAAFRPTCPRSLFDFIFWYHERNKGARWDRPVDLGCGTGQATVELTPFKCVTGIYPSSKIPDDRSCSGYPEENANRINLIVLFVHDACAVGAQACHWFDWNKIWPELARVLRKDGSAAFWIYSEFCFTRYPSLTENQIYSQGVDPLHSVGPHWQQLGRSILENHLVKVPDGNEVVSDAFSEFESVLHSSLHMFHQRNPTNAENPPRGDIAVRFWKDLKEGAEREDGRAVEGHDEVDIEWPLALIMVKRV
ncbi:hypothetical protein BD769DRAFT_1393366 [Suillus cothurnatus]|nr:hypothetical protein BD769DRAFT_1393366 [Suillus cothurnatus]